MIILDVNKVSKNFGYGSLFENVTFSLNEGESISIVGHNGCGKSTLLRLIAKEERLDNGSISIKKDATVAYLDQIISDKSDDRVVKDILLETFKEINNLMNRIKKYEKLMEEDSEKYLESYCKLLEEYSSLGGYDVDVRINTVCSGLGISDFLLNQNYNSLSGGEKTLVQLAKVLLLKPDLLLLDEPTNHLDISRVEWLEKYIKSFKGACVIVSHDRYFLDKMSSKILDLSDIEAKVYNTNYSGYLVEREKEFQKQLSDYKNQQIVIKRLQEQIKYFSERGMATNSSTLCNRAKALQTSLNRILERKVEKPKEQRELVVDFNETKRGSEIVLKSENLSVMKPNGDLILDDVSLIIKSREKVAFIGDNGSGKSTFLKVVLSMSDLDYLGNFFIGPSVNIGYLPQVITFDGEKVKVLDYFKNETCLDEQKSRAILASFHFFKEDVNKFIKNLSGGERVRLKLAILLQSKVNCLIFDEPTNHIDISTKEVLERAVEGFKGTFIFVSHDRYFINKFADKVVEFNNGNLTVYNGNYDYYKEIKNKN